MREEDFKIILTLHKLKSLSKTAQELYISQPTLTKNLKKLEADLGVNLVTRSNKGVVFTAEGELFAIQAEKILVLMEETRQKLENHTIL